MSTKLFFNRFVENLVEKAVDVTGRLRIGRAFSSLHQPVASPNPPRKTLTIPPSNCYVGGISARFVATNLGKLLARQDLLRGTNSGAELNIRVATRISLFGTKVGAVAS
jgi:hypothetical protein